MGSSRSLFSRPASAYYLILGSLVALTALGLVMVLSASSVTALNENGNSFAYVLRQAMFLVLSVGIAWVAMKLRAQLWLPLSRIALVISAALLVLPQMPGLPFKGSSHGAAISLPCTHPPRDHPHSTPPPASCYTQHGCGNRPLFE